MYTERRFRNCLSVQRKLTSYVPQRHAVAAQRGRGRRRCCCCCCCCCCRPGRLLATPGPGPSSFWLLRLLLRLLPLLSRPRARGHGRLRRACCPLRLILGRGRLLLVVIPNGQPRQVRHVLLVPLLGLVQGDKDDACAWEGLSVAEGGGARATSSQMMHGEGGGHTYQQSSRAAGPAPAARFPPPPPQPPSQRRAGSCCGAPWTAAAVTTLAAPPPPPPRAPW